MKKEDKEKLKEAIYDFYKNLFADEGFPDKEIENPIRAIEALQDLYKELESKKVLPEGINFAKFQQIAVAQFRQEHLYAQLSKRGFF